MPSARAVYTIKDWSLQLVELANYSRFGCYIDLYHAGAKLEYGYVIRDIDFPELDLFFFVNPIGNSFILGNSAIIKLGGR